MSGIKTQKSKISQRIQSDDKQCKMTGRSLQSVEANNFKTVSITPWSGDDYYTKVRKQIQQKKPRKRSSTAKPMKSRFNQFKIQPPHSKINTVQLQFAPISVEISKDQWKHVNSKLSTQYIRQDQPIDRQSVALKKQHCSTMLFKEVDPIHKKQSTTKIIRPRVERLHSEIIRNSQSVHNRNSVCSSNPFSDKNDKKCLLFFFETKNNSSLVNRQRMIMKIRNLDKGKALRVYTQKN